MNMEIWYWGLSRRNSPRNFRPSRVADLGRREERFVSDIARRDRDESRRWEKRRRWEI